MRGQTVKITNNTTNNNDTFSSSAKMTTNDFEKNAKKASAFSSAVSPSSKRRRRGRNDKMLGFSSFLWVALCCVFVLRLPRLLGANFSARGGESDNVDV